MALADVVSLLAKTNRIIVDAKATPIPSTRGVGRRRAPGSSTNRAAAATIERKQATCHPARWIDLMTAPPEENSAAAASTSRREARGVGLVSMDEWILVQACPRPNPHPRPLSRPLPPSLTGRG